MTRILFVLLFMGVIGVYALGKGWAGTPPAEEGRQPLKVTQEIAPQAVTLLPHKP